MLKKRRDKRLLLVELQLWLKMYMWLKEDNKAESCLGEMWTDCKWHQNQPLCCPMVAPPWCT